MEGSSAAFLAALGPSLDFVGEACLLFLIGGVTVASFRVDFGAAFTSALAGTFSSAFFSSTFSSGFSCFSCFSCFSTGSTGFSSFLGVSGFLGSGSCLGGSSTGFGTGFQLFQAQVSFLLLVHSQLLHYRSLEGLVFVVSELFHGTDQLSQILVLAYCHFERVQHQQ